MQLRVESIDFFERPTTTRLPFHFGLVSMSRATTLVVRLRASADGVPCEGFAADLLVPKWFDKNPGTSADEDEHSLRQSAELAARALLAQEPAPVFALWQATYGSCYAKAADYPGGGLALGFGVSLIERALIDSACRAAGLAFFDALRADLFQFRPAELRPELAGWEPFESLAKSPLSSIPLRHTIGLLDPLTRAESERKGRVEDGLPESLQEVVEQYGVTRFKIKLGGRPQADLARLQRLAELLPVLCSASSDAKKACSITLDANEQYNSIEALTQLLDELATSSAGASLLEGLRFIEQPIPRAASFDPQLADSLSALRVHAACIIDEADAGLDSFPRALHCGWRGVSVKACKGVFRALTNWGLCEESDEELLLSGEDLTNLPVLPLQQDLALAATLHLPDVERNGQHYFRGLDHLPEREAAGALERHAGLYKRIESGASLQIEQGRLDLRSLTCVGFGYDLPIQLPPKASASFNRDSRP